MVVKAVKLETFIIHLSPESAIWHKMLISSIKFGLFISNLDTKKILERSSHWKHKIIPPHELDLILSTLKFLKLYLCFTVLESSIYLLKISTPRAAN